MHKMGCTTLIAEKRYSLLVPGLRKSVGIFETILQNKLGPVLQMNLFSKKSSEKFRSVPKLQPFLMFGIEPCFCLQF